MSLISNARESEESETAQVRKMSKSEMSVEFVEMLHSPVVWRFGRSWKELVWSLPPTPGKGEGRCADPSPRGVQDAWDPVPRRHGAMSWEQQCCSQTSLSAVGGADHSPRVGLPFHVIFWLVRVCLS